VTVSATDRRHLAREVALQMLYHWEMSGDDLDEVLAMHPKVQVHALDEGHQAFALRLVQGTAERLGEIDPLIEAHAANWRLERLAVIDRLILRIAVFELLDRHDTSPGIVINEALELARTFSGEPAVKFVNGVLDAIRRDLDPSPRP
jgi:N utilization substance protein B